jgi:hypothetical protein
VAVDVVVALPTEPHQVLAVVLASLSSSEDVVDQEAFASAQLARASGPFDPQGAQILLEGLLDI